MLRSSLQWAAVGTVAAGLALPSSARAQGAAAGAAGDSAAAAAPDAEPLSPQAQCFAQHEQSQVLRKEDKLRETREVLASCASEACPALVRTDCLQWFTEVDRAVPSVVVSARQGSRDLVDVKVFIDGKLVSTSLDGRATELDPGRYKFRLEAPDLEPLEQDVVVAAGEKGRLVTFSFPEPRRAEEPGATPGAPATYRPVTATTWVLGGVTVVASGVFAGLGIATLLKKDDYSSSCSPSCSDDQVSEVQSLATATDVTLAIAATAGAATLVSYLVRPTKPVPAEQPASDGAPSTAARTAPRRGAVRFGVAPTGEGVSVSLGGRF